MRYSLETLVRRAAKRRALAAELATAARPRRLTHTDGRRLLVSPDLEAPGQWRVTSFDRQGEPWGHTCHRDAEAAFDDALTWGAFSLEPTP